MRPLWGRPHRKWGRAPSRHHHCLLQIRRPVWHFAWPDLRDRAESQESGH